MKHVTHLMLALGLFFCFSARGQALKGRVSASTPGGDYTALIDSLSQRLDKSRIPTGILYDRSLGLSGLVNPLAAQLGSGQTFRQSYYDLWTAAPAAARSPTLLPYSQPALVQLADNLITAGQLPIGVLDAQFAVLDTLAEERGTIVQSGGLYYDGPASAGSAYQLRKVCLVAPLADTSASPVPFTLPATLLLQNSGRKVVSVLVSVDGLSFTLAPGGSYSANLAGGAKSVAFTVKFADGTTSLAKSALYVRSSVASRTALSSDPVVLYISPNITSRDYWTDYRGLGTYGEGQARGFMQVPASKLDNKLRNIVVVLDGFDPGDKRPIDGQGSINEMIAPLTGSFGVPGKEHDLVILNFPTSSRTVTIGGVYSNQSIDGGADYIERNALVLVELFTRLKPLMFDASQKITVIGPSMGGLIARYALALMEKNYAAGLGVYWQHPVNLWISLDAPHGGADVPIGDQFFVNYFTPVSEPARRSYVRITSVAAMQMCVTHFLDPDRTQFRLPFMRNLLNNGVAGSMGYPTLPRRAVVADGSLNGLMNVSLGNPGQTGVQLDVVRNAGYGRRSFFYRTTAVGTQISANMYFSPNTGQGPVFDGQARAIVALATGVARRTHIEQVASANGSYDLAPGGVYNTQFQIQDLTVRGPQKAGYTYSFSNNAPYHSFIPTVSALGFLYRSSSAYDGTGLLPSPYTNLAARQLLCNDEIPFDSYYGEAQTSVAHVSTNANATQYILRELNSQSAPVVFSPLNVSYLCIGKTTPIALLSCQDRYTPALTTWTLSGPAVFTSTNNAGPVNYGGLSQSVRVTGAGTVVVTVVSTRPAGSPSPPASYTLRGISSSTLNLLSSASSVCPGSAFSVTATYFDGAILQGWRTDNGSVTGSVGKTACLTAGALGTMSVFCDYTSVCDAAGAPLRTTLISVNVGSSPTTPCASPTGSPVLALVSGPTLAVYPNPGDGSVHVRSPFGLGTPSRLELYDEWGKLVHAELVRGTENEFDTRAYPSGLYHLLLRQGTKSRRYNLNLQH